MKRLLLSVPLTIPFLLSCMLYFDNPSMTGDLPGLPATVKLLRTDWEKYGAYYECDEFNALCEEYWGKMRTNYVVNKRLRILTVEGENYATVFIPLRGELVTCRVSLIDSAGNAVQLDSEKIVTEFKHSGLIVCPKVTVHSTIDIHVLFSKRGIPGSIEHPFVEPIPVLNGSFSFTYPENHIEYGCKVYGHVDSTGNEASGSYGSPIQYFCNNVLPHSRIPWSNDYCKNEPRISVSYRKNLNKYFTEENDRSSWAGLASYYSQVLYKTSTFGTTDMLHRQTHEVADSMKTGYQKADAVLRWVQENFTPKLKLPDKINPDKVLKNKEGDVWDITYVLKIMMQELGCYEDIIVSRSRWNDGFDPDFITPASLSWPFVIVSIDGKRLVADPFVAGSRLGEYPTGFIGEKGLSLENHTTTSFPEPPSQEMDKTVNYILSLDPDSMVQKQTINYEGLWSYTMRTELQTETEEQRKETFQKMLTEQGSSNAIISFTHSPLENRQGPLTIYTTFSSPGQVLHRNKESIFRFDHLFQNHFSGYDTSRSSPVQINFNEVITENITVLKDSPGEFHVPLLLISNDLFELTSTEGNNRDKYTFSRTLRIKKGVYKADVMRRLYPDILKMNSIKESYAILR